METRAFWPGELEIRARGRRLGGRFRYSRGAGDAMATVSDRGRRRKERIAPDAFGWQLREFQKLQTEYAAVADKALDRARVELLRQEMERRNVHVLAGHSYDRPLGDLRSGTATITSTREAVDFEVDLPAESDMPSYMRDTMAMIRAGLVGGISPGFKVPPRDVVPDAEGLEPEPGNPAVQVRVIKAAVLYELSLVTRPSYTETEIDLRAEDVGLPAEPKRRPRVWL